MKENTLSEKDLGNSPFQYTIECQPMVSENLSCSGLSTNNITVDFVGNISLSKVYYEKKAVKTLTISTEQLWDFLNSYSKLDIKVNKGVFY